MNKPHKHAKLIKLWADGAEIEGSADYGNCWYVTANPNWESPFCQFRLKRPDWQQKLIDAAKEGKTIEFLSLGIRWHTSSLNRQLDNYEFGALTETDFRIKPEPKPDTTLDYHVQSLSSTNKIQSRVNLRLTFDGETGDLKKSEVIHGN